MFPIHKIQTYVTCQEKLFFSLSSCILDIHGGMELYIHSGVTVYFVVEQGPPFYTELPQVLVVMANLSYLWEKAKLIEKTKCKSVVLLCIIIIHFFDLFEIKQKGC